MGLGIPFSKSGNDPSFFALPETNIVTAQSALVAAIVHSSSCDEFGVGKFGNDVIGYFCRNQKRRRRPTRNDRMILIDGEGLSGVESGHTRRKAVYGRGAGTFYIH